jgi:hypothetical protein
VVDEMVVLLRDRGDGDKAVVVVVVVVVGCSGSYARATASKSESVSGRVCEVLAANALQKSVDVSAVLAVV